ncbi:MAG: YkgJ family cysteine cluster protein [Methanoregula sp.]|nr:YkgJ family cysteine cluster protein [Methanoregula sp.]
MCAQCGECCSSMGEIIEIREELDSCSFRIGLTVTGEDRIVSLDADKQDLFRLTEIKTVRPMACPLLRKDGNKKFVCSVHASRPELCRQYSCYRILILDSGNNRVGRVADASRYFTTTDARLRKIWDGEIANRVIPDERCWEEHVDQTLTRAGFRVER